MIRMQKNLIVFDLISRTNETRYIKLHETCKRQCRLDASVCNNKQGWNEGNCRCECKGLIDKGSGGKGFILNPSNCDVGEYLDYENCKCRKSLVDKLVEECSENIDEDEMVYDGTLNDHKNVYGSCTMHIVLFVIFFVMTISISSVFIYLHWYLKRRYIETTIY